MQKKKNSTSKKTGLFAADIGLFLEKEHDFEKFA